MVRSHRFSVLSLLAASGALLGAAPTAKCQSYTGQFGQSPDCGPSQNDRNVPIPCGIAHDARMGRCFSSCISFPDPALRADIFTSWDRRTAPGLLFGRARVDMIFFIAPCGGTHAGSAGVEQSLLANDLIFYARDNPSQPGSAPASLNLVFSGRGSGASHAGCISSPLASVAICAGVSTSNTTVVCNLIQGNMDGFGSFGGVLASYPNDDSAATITSPMATQPLNTPRAFYMSLVCTAVRRAGCGTETSSFIEATGTLSLPTSGPVFQLPEGITCRSEQLRIVDNHWLGPACCPADFNQSGELSVQDIFDFLSGYFTGC